MYAANVIIAENFHLIDCLIMLFLGSEFRMEDSFLHKGLRQQLVDTIRAKGIHDERILRAIGQVPRHGFMDSSFLHSCFPDPAA